MTFAAIYCKFELETLPVKVKIGRHISNLSAHLG